MLRLYDSKMLQKLLLLGGGRNFLLIAVNGIDSKFMTYTGVTDEITPDVRGWPALSVLVRRAC